MFLNAAIFGIWNVKHSRPMCRSKFSTRVLCVFLIDIIRRTKITQTIINMEKFEADFYFQYMYVCTYVHMYVCIFNIDKLIWWKWHTVISWSWCLFSVIEWYFFAVRMVTLPLSIAACMKMDPPVVALCGKQRINGA